MDVTADAIEAKTECNFIDFTTFDFHRMTVTIATIDFKSLAENPLKIVQLREQYQNHLNSRLKPDDNVYIYGKAVRGDLTIVLWEWLNIIEFNQLLFMWYTTLLDLLGIKMKMQNKMETSYASITHSHHSIKGF